MDALLKRKMQRVAIIHIVATASLCLFMVLTIETYANSIEQRVFRDVWLNFFEIVLIILQPPAFLFILLLQHLDFVPNQPLWLMVSIYYGALLLLSCVWSLCFGWLFVKLDNWLNHFPKLGRKAF
jgi:hypothetical protein